MKKKYYKYILISIIIVTVLTFAYLINKIYTVTLEDAKKNHQLQQLQMAKIVGEGINYFMEHLVNDMSLLVSNSKIITNEESILKQYINHYQADYNKKIISTVLIFDVSSKVLYSAGVNPPDWVTKQSNIIIKNLSSDTNRNNYSASEIFPNKSNDFTSGKSFLIIFSTSPSNEQKTIKNTYIGFIVNFDLLIEHFIKPLQLGNKDFIWILDGDGRLVYHPNHEEMLFNSIYDNDKKCLSCHTSFDNQKKMLASNVPSFGAASAIFAPLIISS